MLGELKGKAMETSGKPLVPSVPSPCRAPCANRKMTTRNSAHAESVCRVSACPNPNGCRHRLARSISGRLCIFSDLLLDRLSETRFSGEAEGLASIPGRSLPAYPCTILVSMSGHLSPEDGKALLISAGREALCGRGVDRLREVDPYATTDQEDTPSSGHGTRLPQSNECLIRHEERLEVGNEALANAVERKRFDVVELLVSYGADIRSVPLSDVLLTWEPRMMAFFWTAGRTLSRTHHLPLLSARKSGQCFALMSSTRRRTRNWRRVFRSKLTAPSDISAMKEI